MHHDTKKSLLLGGIIGSVLTGLFMSKKGKEMRKQALLVASHLYKELDKKAEHLLELSQEKYEELVEVLVKEYAKKKDLADEMRDQVTQRLKAQWEHLEVDGLLRLVRKEFARASDQTKEAYGEIVDVVVEKYTEEKALGVGIKKRLAKEIMERYQIVKDEYRERKI